MTEYSVFVPFDPQRGDQILPFAALTQWSTAHRLWQGQGSGGDPYQIFAVAAAHGFRTPCGTGVALMPSRHPFDAALQARTLALTTGHPVTACFGPGSRALQRRMLGAPYASPLTAAREYLTIVRDLLHRGSADLHGEYFACDAELAPVPGPPVELGLGVLRPAMAELAGAVADVAVTWMTPAAYLAGTVVPALRAGAAAAGRPAPRLTAIVPLALERPGRRAADLALAGSGHHLRAPHYTAMLRRAGVTLPAEPGDPSAAAAALVRGGGFLYGSGAELADQLAGFERASVDEIVLNVTGVATAYGRRAALDELRDILVALTAPRHHRP
ncbi:LLM class flavin-dependent oxidoreductase [Kitasatospora sp. NPDC098652]|uniref:LLM class flavin-dependent oxidoreductase n=1 Tax=Kitasatospora sp. NPDC098652 TaxID=3364095 RepID=UPI00382AB224